MFPGMRRKRQMLSIEESEEVLKRGTSGVLALLGVEDYPYTVPLSYVYEEGKIYFHGARCGHKIDAIRKHDKASFCVIDQDEILSGQFATCYKSVIAFGKIRILEDEQEIRAAVTCLSDRYYPGMEKERDREIEKDWQNLCMMELSIVHLTGKQAIELVRE